MGLVITLAPSESGSARRNCLYTTQPGLFRRSLFVIRFYFKLRLKSLLLLTIKPAETKDRPNRQVTMNKDQAQSKLQRLKARARELIGSDRDSQVFKKWRRDTEVTIEHIFGKDSRHNTDFTSIRYRPRVYSIGVPQNHNLQKWFNDGLETAITLFDSFIEEIEEYGINHTGVDESRPNHIENLNLVISRFHQVARQLRSRHGDRPAIEIEDEYDVQYLFHALLKLYFDDVRPEEYVPSYAGSSSRVDFLLKEAQIIIEIKRTRARLGAKEVGEELMIDSMRYRSHPDCKQLVCFVYDPEGRIANPQGLESDLSKDINGVPVTVFIRPNQ